MSNLFLCPTNLSKNTVHDKYCIYHEIQFTKLWRKILKTQYMSYTVFLKLEIFDAVLLKIQYGP